MIIKLLSINCRSAVFLVGMFLLVSVSTANAATITSAGSGNWATVSTWVGGVVPSATDNVTIIAGHTVTVAVSANITNLNLSTSTSKLVINSSQTLTVSGTFSNLGTTTNGVNGPGTILFTGTASFGILTATGVRPNIVIGDGLSTNTVTVGANILVTDMTINVGAILSVLSRTISINGFFTNSGTVSGTSGQIKLATGNFINNGTVTLTTTGQVNVTAGNFSNNGSVSIATGAINVATGSLSSTGSLVYTAAGFLRLGGAFTYSGTFMLGSAAVQFTGAANQWVPAFTTTGTVSMLKTGGTAAFTGNVNGGGLTINGTGGTLSLVSGTHSFSGTWTRTAGAIDCGSSLLRIGLNGSGIGGTFTAGTGTVEYYRLAAQTVVPLTYNNLTLSGSGIKTLTTTTTVNKILSMEGTATASGAPTYVAATATLQYNIEVARTVGAEWVSPFAAIGGVVINGNQTTTLNTAKVFNASVPLTINSGAKLATGNFSLTFGGDFINNGGTFTSTGPIVIANTMVTQSIAGFSTTGLVSMTKTSGAATFGGSVNGAGLTINGAGGNLNLGITLHHIFTGAVALISGTLNGGSSTLNVNFTGSAWTGTGSNFVPGTGTVKFGGIAQTLTTGTTFNNLTFFNSGLKTLTGVPNVSGILSMEGSATVSAAPTYGAAATLQYNRTATQVAGVEWITPFAATGGVSIINTGAVTANAIKAFNTTAPLNIAAGATLDNGGFAISGSSSITVVDVGTLKLSGTSTFPVFTTTTLAANSAVSYSGAAQNVAIINYGDLLLSGSGNKAFMGVTTISGDFEISGAAVALLFNSTACSTSTLTLGGILQTTLGSYGGTGSTATSANASWFGSTTTGTINVTGSCLPGTWLGLTSTDWSNASNWCSGIIPTVSSNVIIAPTPNQPVIGTSGGICKNITIKTGAILTNSGSNTLTVSGDWTNNGSFISNTSMVSFKGTVGQTIGGSSVTTFNNLTNANTTAIVSAASAISIKNSLSIANSASVIDMETYPLIDGGSFSNTGVGQFRTANTSGMPIPAGKTWNGSVIYSNPAGGQTIVSGTYNGTPSINLDNTSGTQTASGNIITGGQLNINNGGTPVFDLNGYNLTTNALNIITPNSVLDMRGGALSYASVLSMDGTIRFSGATNAKTFASGTIEYYGASQTVTNGSYYNLLFSGATGVYTMASDINVANTLTVANGAVTLQSGYTLSLGNAINVVDPGMLTIENNATLLQTTYSGANYGNVIVKRNTSPVLRYDATFWCSPTTGTQTLHDFSPLTDSDRFNDYDSVNDVYTTLNATATVFGKGIGYSIRCPVTTSSTVPTVISYQFVGVPNNGSFTIPLSTPTADIGLSLIGNPYPSSLNADDFINENLYNPISNPTNTLSGTYYFWSHNTRLAGNDFSSDDYYTCNFAGPTGFTNSGTGNNTLPSGYIASGQGFFVENQIAGNLKFDNSMRETKNNTNFYKIKSTKKIKDLERHRIWLDLTNSAMTTGSQTLVGYIENATNDYDFGYDSYLFDNTRPLLIYSLLGADAISINGRALPFLDSDTIPIGYFTSIADNVTLSINRVDGLFLYNQQIYLEDKLLKVIHDLKEAPYSFDSAAGKFNDRFVLRYTDVTLGNSDFQLAANGVLISKDKKELKIKSGLEDIKQVVVFDALGRKVFEKDAINDSEFHTSVGVLKDQMGIVKVTLDNGEVISKKVIF